MTDKLKPFDLTAALAGAPVVTRDGRKVLQISHFPQVSKSHEVIAAIEGNKYVQTANKFGRLNNCVEDNSDLFMAPVKRTVWVNMYRDCNGKFFAGHVGDSKGSTAVQFDPENYVGTYPLEIEE